jgi:hypothetical protein
MSHSALAGWLFLALFAQEEPAGEEPAPASVEEPEEPARLEERVRELELELQRLKLQAEEPAESAAEEPEAAPAAQANIFNPTITVFGNGLFRYDDRPVGEDDERADKVFSIREVEIDFRAAVDPFADAVVIAAFEAELPGTFEAGIEEGYVTIKTLPIPVLDDPPLGLKLRFGRFRADIGRVNRIHLHDLPQVTRPLVIEEFYGEEGYVADGASAQLFLPFFDEGSALELIAQVATGGGPAIADAPRRFPAFVGHLRWFRTFADAHNFDLSLIFHGGRVDPDGAHWSTVYSADFLYKWKPLRGGEFRSFVLGGQVFYARTLGTEPYGYFAFGQYQLSRETYLGVRWDDTRTLADETLKRRAIGGFLSWYPSEFLRLRFGYERRLSELEEEDRRNSFFAEINFVFGAHPPEPFWVNR